MANLNTGWRGRDPYPDIGEVQLDYEDAPDGTVPATKTYHGIAIHAGPGLDVVGKINSWQPNTFTRSGVWIKELNVRSFGRPVDYVPGVVDAYTITASRAEVWGEEFEKAVGLVGRGSGNEWIDLIDQHRAFTCTETWYRGKTGQYSKFKYLGCWFQDLNFESAFSIDGDVVVRRSATINFVRKWRVY